MKPQNANSFCIGFDTSQLSNKELEMFLLTFLHFKTWDCQISKNDVEVRDKTGRKVLIIFCNYPERPIMFLDTFESFGLFCKEFTNNYLFSKFGLFMEHIQNELKYY